MIDNLTDDVKWRQGVVERRQGKYQKVYEKTPYKQLWEENLSEVRVPMSGPLFKEHTRPLTKGPWIRKNRRKKQKKKLGTKHRPIVL